MPDPIRLYGRIILEADIHALTGLRIGGSPGALAIGGVDLPVIRNVVTQEPYIPGSSLKGKMRSLWEKAKGCSQNSPIGKGVTIHTCKRQADYEQCPVCQIYGTLGQNEAAFPTRLVVRDIALDTASLRNARTDMPWTEVKWEAAIDRVTSAASPRQIERVPAGALFKPMQIVFNLYTPGDHRRFLDVLTALQLVEDDYLGGHGSRGSGRVAFENLQISCRHIDRYNTPETRTGITLSGGDDLLAWLEESIPLTVAGGH